MTRRLSRLLLTLALVTTASIYWPGLYGGWLFDDYPNIVDNHGVQPASGDISSLIGAALSSPASDFKRPLASLSFAANFLASGLDPFWMKQTNLVIHLLNGVLAYLLALAVFRATAKEPNEKTIGLLAVLVATSWLLLPINVTSVLYVVQRMESMANLFVMLGLLGYVAGRRRMLAGDSNWRWLSLTAASITLPTAIGALAKETAVMLPLYALLTEYMLFGFLRQDKHDKDWRIVTLFVVVLALPMALGLAWLIPSLTRPEAWATRDFNMGTRLLTEARVVTDYINWTLLPLPHSLSFYYDDYPISNGLFSPWSTAASLCTLIALATVALWLHKRRPAAALGIALFLGCHLLTGTILPLELVYEHRNYFASFGLMLALVSLLFDRSTQQSAMAHRASVALMTALLLWWTGLTATTAFAWGEPLRLALMLAERAPHSPRAQYELGRTYIIYSKNDPSSPYTQLAYAPLERAAALPKSSILPQQALIFMNSRMSLPLKEAWWESMDVKLRAQRPGVQDESSLAALVQCAEHGQCKLPPDRMQTTFEAAMSHTNPSPRLLSTYAEYAWNVVDDQSLGVELQTRAADGAPHEPAYLVTLIHMLLARGEHEEAQNRLEQLERLNVGGHLDSQIDTLHRQIDSDTSPGQSSP
ncbi:hypothetical protein [Dyella silvae]|uniref:hypothetical protein n=1 Tax=Dyella silvae TaxID=2994424 RepID=UPI00226503D2|nr:hypothetical protein [Dyella silvae]